MSRCAQLRELKTSRMEWNVFSADCSSYWCFTTRTVSIATQAPAGRLSNQPAKTWHLNQCTHVQKQDQKFCSFDMKLLTERLTDAADPTSFLYHITMGNVRGRGGSNVLRPGTRAEQHRRKRCVFQSLIISCGGGGRSTQPQFTRFPGVPRLHARSGTPTRTHGGLTDPSPL